MREYIEPLKENVKTDYHSNANGWKHRAEPRAYINGKHFRESLRRPLPTVKQVTIRVVPAFSYQSLQKNTVVVKPPRARPRQARHQPQPSLFQTFYKRGDLPFSAHFRHMGVKLIWKVDFDKLDYNVYLPMFFEGLRDTHHPFCFYAHKGLQDLLAHGGDKILPCVPHIIMPIKRALNTRNKTMIRTTLKTLQILVRSSEDIGEALVPYYRQLLPICNLFFNDENRYKIDVSGTVGTEESLGKVIENTLNILEMNGGDDAYINIKYMVPLYESCVYK